ncbi:MAG TPA: hypothetical protein VHF47_05225 [Acidimicrobiales bacterium]|nr:hypothetical protein [Acidimicrobiales bacterium]
MGAKGIRRRKPYRRLPPARMPDDNELVPPNVMWPGPGSGFEAHPWSPAGRAQETWRFARALGGGRGRRGRRTPVARLVSGALVVVVAAALLAEVVAILL